MTDSSGTIVNTYTYDPWGNPISTSETIAQPYRYAGYRWDSDTGLYYLRARYYDSETGRFLSSDLFKGNVTHPDSFNPYLYAKDNPTVYTDPAGLWGVGLTLGETTDIGIYTYGAGQTGSISSGAFSNGTHASFASWGGFIGNPNHGPYYPHGGKKGTGNQALGLYAGIGAGVFITNATNINDMSGVFNVYSVNAGYGEFKFSFQEAISNNGIRVFSISPPGAPTIGIGLSYGHYLTDTYILGG